MAKPAVPNLVQAAHSMDEDLDREALNALAKIMDTSAGPQLIDLLASPNKAVKRDAAATVGILRARNAVPKLQALFENDPDQKTREKALEGLAYLGDPVSVPLFTKALWREDKAMRTSAAEGLARAGDTKALPELEKAAGVEKDADPKLADAFALTALGKEDYLAALVHELSSRLRGDVAVSYLRELSREPKFLPKLYPFLSEEDASVRRRLCTVLIFTGNQTSLEHLERLSHDPNGDVASEALRAMRAIRARS
jgi:HEAT repeat protein